MPESRDPKKILEEFYSLKDQLRERFLKYCRVKSRGDHRKCLESYNNLRRFFFELKRMDEPVYVKLYVENLIPVMRYVLLKRERSTFKTYWSILWSYTKFLIRNKVYIFDVDMDVLNKYFTQGVDAERRSENTLLLINNILRSFYNHYNKKDIVEHLRKIKFRKVLRFKVDLTDEEYEKIYHAVSDLRVKLALELIAGSGLRPGEALGITWGDVDTKSEPWMVQIRYIPNSPYGAKGISGEGKVPITERAKKLILYLRRIYIEKYATDPMLVDKGGRIINISYRTLDRYFKKAVRKAGLRKRYPLTLHKLRHYFGHRWMNKVKNVIQLKEVMRHSNINYTLVYANPSEEEIKRSFEEINRE